MPYKYCQRCGAEMGRATCEEDLNETQECPSPDCGTMQSQEMRHEDWTVEIHHEVQELKAEVDKLREIVKSYVTRDKSVEEQIDCMYSQGE